MAKSYSPVKITDPTDNHVIVLHPNQELVLTLSPSFGAVDVDAHSHFLKLASTTSCSASQVYVFKQAADFSRWSKFSKFYLGNVIVINKADIITICVVLETTNKQKSKHITVINPEGHEVKLDKDGLLEVVVYDKKLGDYDYWKANIVQGDFGVTLQQVNYEVITPPNTPPEEFFKFCEKMVNADDDYCAFPRAESCREHHFWFRYDADSSIMIDNMDSGICDGGKLVFDGVAAAGNPRNLFNILNVRLNVKKRESKELPPMDVPSFRGNEKKVAPPSAANSSQSCLYTREIVLREKPDNSLDSDSRVVYYKLNE